ncbi:hypothetical protein BH23CHL7_BH23CHL7_07600 [soil metagenome]
MKRSLAIVLSALIGVTALPAVGAAQNSTDALWNQPGPGVVRNETGAPGRDIYVVRHRAPSLAEYRGGTDGLAATSPEATGARKLNPDSAASRAYLAYLDGVQDRLHLAIEAELGRNVEVVFRYDAVYNGIAVRINANEAQRVAGLPGVRQVERDSTRHLHTDNGPRWIGADEIWGEDPVTGNAHCVGTCGEGVVVGIIDTGVNFDHPSFADIGGDGYDHTNPRGTFFGVCAPITGLPFCNDKLIGYYDFTGTGPEDDNGHGSHTASTTAGNVVHAVVEAPTISIERDVSGVAPHANIISYKGCSGTPIGCQLSALVAAINQATLDQVDVINYSIGGASANPWEDLDAQAFFGAYEAGIFVATSAGNDGPGPRTVGSPGDAPWVTTVAASTHDRRLANGLVNMTNANSTSGPADVFGKSLTSAYGPARVVYAGDYAAESSDPGNAHLCGAGVGDPATGEGSGGDPWPAGTFNGEIVLCERGEYGRVMKGEYARRAGAGGMVLMNDAASGDSLIGDPYTLPAVHITHTDGLIVKQWIADNGGKTHAGTARINGSDPDEDPAYGDVMASFSSRGPNAAVPSLIKPDVTAPGVDILAAWMSPVGSLGEIEWGVISGTSMSSPHTAGAGALVLAARPAWSPDAVKSALMTTAFSDLPGNGAEVHGVLKEDSSTPADPFDTGSGRVDLHVAASAGLVFVETAAGYEAANPFLGGDPTSLNIASLGQDYCPAVCVWTRSITSTASTTVTWTPSATTPSGMSITFNQASYTLAPGATVDITITADVSGVSPKNQWTFAEVQLTPSVGSVPPAHLPVAVIPVDGQAATVLHMHGNNHDGCTGNGSADVAAGAEACQPHLSFDDQLDSNPAAAWGPIQVVDGTSAQNLYDPNWIWNLSEPTTLHGPMTVEYWYTSPNKLLVFNLDFTVRLWADGVLVVEEVFRHNATLPTTELISHTMTLPKVTANDSFVVHIDPFFATQEGAFIYYDSTQPCPGTAPGTQAPCDSRVLMPVVDLVDNLPIARDDTAFVVRGGSVIVDVLANDEDAEGPLAVTIVSGPTNGTADVTLDNRISYSHDGSATTSDSLVYEITDTAGQKDQATVFITIADECFAPGGDYAIDFESGSPGWTVDTAVLNPPSQTWQLLSPDPFATSGTTVWFTDAATFLEPNLGSTTKDVRLVTPEFLLSGDSHLTFYHRFRTEVGFDGGVLEASVNGGAWQDIEDAGGVFFAGDYNDTFAASGFVLSGRDGWGGESAGFIDGDMNQVDVNLGALAAQSVQFRFRFGQDELVGEAGGWWIDDFAVDDLLEPCGEAPVASNDSASVDAGMSVNIDVLANDSDPTYPNSDLTVTIESAPSHGTAVVETDQTITYDHNGNNATSDSFVYRVTNPDGGFDSATVSITINQEPADVRKTTGGGYLNASDGKKINFGFNAAEAEDGSLSGELQLNDNKDKVKIHLKEVLTFNQLEDECGTVPAGPGSVEFTGDGKFNGKAASFRVCVADFDEPGNSNASATPDMFHLECIDSCTYDTSSRAPDEELDGGNIQVHNPEAAEEETGGAPEAGGTASTLILDPVLLSEAKIGSARTLTVRAFGPDQSPLANASISLDVLDAAGSLLNTLTGSSDASGVLTLSVVIGAGTAEYLAWSGSLSSNAILVKGSLF